MAEVLMPRLSDTMEEGTVAKWLKRAGDAVSRGDVLAEIDTDKATMDLEAYEEGVVERLLVEEGATVPIGAPIAVIAAAGAAPSAAPPASSGAPALSVGSPASSAAAPSAAPPAPSAAARHGAPPASSAAARHGAPPASSAAAAHGAPPASSAAAPHGAPPAPTPHPGPVPRAAAGPRPPARSSPLARRIARRYGIDMATIMGSGPGGRVVRADVEAAVARAGSAAAPATVEAVPGAPAVARPGPGAAAPVAPAPATASAGDVKELPLSTIRRVTAERLTKSLEAPHFYLTSAVDAQRLLVFRAEIVRAAETESRKVTVTDLLVKACAKALRAHPEVNSSWGGDRIFRYLRVNVGVAVAVPEGLVVPVVKDADKKSLAEVAGEAHALASKAREGKLSLDDISGGTFTISNLGMFGVDHFTAVLNPPQAAILAVGAAKAEPVVRDGELAVSTVMRVTLSIDHRVLDGASAARFLADLRDLLENPLRIVL
jgi:pyruvate dehydrogenase E2 component (dihydrolipoamide acetyltransferase)